MTIHQLLLPVDGGGVPRHKRVPKATFYELIKVLAPIGILSFGGTQANLALFYQMFVTQKEWIKPDQFADLLVMAQSLPGPSAVKVIATASSISTGSYLGGIIAVFFFCTPCAVLMAILGVNLALFPTFSAPPALGLSAITLVVSGSFQLGRKLVTTKLMQTAWVICCAVAICSAGNPQISSYATLSCLVLGGLLTGIFGPQPEIKGADGSQSTTEIGISKACAIFLFFCPWIGTIVACFFPFYPPAILYKTGSLVFGGGPIVIPLLLLNLVSTHYINTHQFLLGFSAVSCLPGPMFNLAAFIGGLHGGYLNAAVLWACLMFPGIIMQFGVLPFWSDFRSNKKLRKILSGVNAAAAGLMGASAFILWMHLVTTPYRAAFVICCTGLREITSIPPYFIIVIGILFSAFFYATGIPF